MQTLEALARHYKFSVNDRWEDLPKKAQRRDPAWLRRRGVSFAYDDGMRRYDTKKQFEGVIRNLERRYCETDSEWAPRKSGAICRPSALRRLQRLRLKPEALSVKIGGMHIGQVCEQSVRDAARWFTALTEKLDPSSSEIAARILQGDPTPG